VNKYLVRQFLASSRLLRSVRLARSLDAVLIDNRFLSEVGKRGISQILDIGAHEGESTATYLSRTQADVYAFEPNPDACKVFEERLGAETRVQLSSVALNDAEGDATLNRTKNDQATSLLSPSAEGLRLWGAPLQPDGSFLAAGTTLDNWMIDHLPDATNVAIKIDVQGAEGRVLEGGMATLQERTELLVTEAQIAPTYDGQAGLNEILATLHGSTPLRLAAIAPCATGPDGRALQTDLLFIRP